MRPRPEIANVSSTIRIGMRTGFDVSNAYMDIGVDTPAGALPLMDSAVFDDLIECAP